MYSRLVSGDGVREMCMLENLVFMVNEFVKNMLIYMQIKQRKRIILQ
jgi:hypothetical protein